MTQSKIKGIQVYQLNKDVLTNIQLETEYSFEAVTERAASLSDNTEVRYIKNADGRAFAEIKVLGSDLDTKMLYGKGLLDNFSNTPAGLMRRVYGNVRYEHAKRREAVREEGGLKARMDEDGISFHIDRISVVLSRGYISVKGWVYSRRGTVAIESRTFDYQVDRLPRPELKEIFGDAGTDNGFEIRLYPKLDSGKCLSFVMDDGTVKYAVQYEISNENIADCRNQASAMYNELKINNNRLDAGHGESFSLKGASKLRRNILISVVIPVLAESEEKKEELTNALRSLRQQSYGKIEIIAVGSCCTRLKNKGNIKYIEDHSSNKEALILKGICEAAGTYICFMEQEDAADEVWIQYLVSVLANRKQVVFCDYDISYRGKSEILVRREDDFFQQENENKLLTAVMADRKLLSGKGSIREIAEAMKALEQNEIEHCTDILYHSCLSKDVWRKERTKPIAFYLTQYHENEENNKWWGQGFTEWMNVRRAVPMFDGHHQPRIPADLGYYDLVTDSSILPRQILMAKSHGIYGFCFYYYWFRGKRLLRKPLDIYLENPKLDLPYCICWANESWTRRWDGRDEEILMEQVHNAETDEQFILDVIPMLRDERYIKVDGKPLLLIYRIDLLEKPEASIERWKKICREQGVGEIHVAIVQSFDITDPYEYGADSAVEFPPHKIGGRPIEPKPEGLREEFAGNIYSYKEMVERLSIVKKREYPLHPGSMLEWDNTARRMENANIYTEFSPELFRKWLIRNHTYTRLYSQDGIMFINAWNEWAEGSCLEPEEKYGTALLDIVKEVTELK